MNAIEPLPSPRCAAMTSGEDRELCVLDFGRLGMSGAQALNELLAMRSGVPILVGGQLWREDRPETCVRQLVRRSDSVESFRLAVSRLRRTGAPMYLRLQY